jgi:uncharacterized RDD family membrane protein YckC
LSNYTAPAEVTQLGTPAPAHATPGGFGIRFAARLIDAGIGLVIGFTGGLVGAIVVALTRGPRALATGRNVMGSPHAIEAIAGSLLISTVGVTAYHLMSEWIGGASLGKLALGLRVRNAQLGPCTFGGALIRTLGYYIDALFFGLVAYLVMQESDTKQRLGDKWGNTVVVEASSLPQGADDVGRVIVGVCVGIALWIAVAAMQALVQAAILAQP